ncbi:MAG TPA: M20/M25/M40 family metallo-hydrolase [Solirubrobacteraceae bacterium]|nr:M20/M25/M40 family metallo-hydrolase [Solirubrobacteraceae bacterium]
MIDARELATFAAVPAPTGAEEQRIAWLEERLAAAPGTRRRDGAGNLIWSFGDGRPELLMMAHVDTVFDADTELRFTRDGDFLVGPGVGDNATAVMATVWALEGLEPPAGLVVAFTVGEEGLGNLRGARQVCADLAPVRAIAVEGHGLDHVVIEHVGSVRARLAVTGPGGHSWRDRGRPSALHALIALGDELVDEGVNIGRMSGGGAVNAIASAAEMLVELRSVDDAVLSAFEARLRALAVPAPLALQCEVVGRRGAGQIAADDPLVRAVLDARRPLGLGETFGAGSTDANAAAALGIPAVGIGCAHGEGMHTLHERIDLMSLETGVRQLQAVLSAAMDL